MALARAKMWTEQTMSTSSQSIIFLEQTSVKAELPIRELMAVGPEHAWYWSDHWQAWEKEADEDREAGRYEVFESMDDFIEALDTH